jgi:protocatechuate 3,4-dioxygenase beta subunit
MSTAALRTQVGCVECRWLLILVVAFVASPAHSSQVTAPVQALQPPAAKSQKLELCGTVVDDDGRPVARATVRGTYLVSGGTQSSGPIPECLTDGEGRFTLEVPVNVAGTVVHLIARHGHAFMATPAKLTGAALVQPITLRISPKHARAVSVRVLDEDGKPVPRAVITPVLHHHFLLVQPEASAPKDKERWVTDAQGRFESPKQLEPIGSYQLELRATGFHPETTAAKLALESDAAVLAFGDVVLKRIRSVEGKVLDRQGRPVAGARIVQADGRQRVEGNTDAEGRFKLDAAFLRQRPDHRCDRGRR